MGHIRTNRALEAYIKSYATGIPGPVPGGDAFPNTYSLEFDGVDEYLKTSTPFSALDGGTALSVSVWIKPTDVASIEVVLHNPKDTTNGNSQFFLWLLKGNRIDFSKGTESYYIRGDISAITYGSWNHILITWDSSISPSSDRGKMYVNGVDETTGYNAGTPATIDTAIDGFYIGETNTGYYNPFTGLIDEVSVFSTALGASDIAKISAAPIDLKTALSVTPEVWYRDGDSTKALFFNSIWQIPDEMKVDNFSQYSMALDGVGDRIDLGSAVSLGTTSTISFWFKSTTAMAGKTIIGEGTYTYFYLCQVSSGIDSVYLRIGGVVKTFTGVTEISNGNWNNWCIVRSGDSIELFINGVSKGTQTGYGTGTDTQFDTIGAQGDGAGNIVGQIADVSCFDAAKEASTIYNSGVPSDLSADSDLQGYWLMGEGANWNNTNWQLPDYSKKALFSQKSFELDGVDDYVDLGTSSDLKPSNVSFSAWYYPEAVGTKGAIISSGNKTGGWSPYSINHWTTDKLCLLMSTDTNNQVFSTATLSYNQWYHIAVTYDGSSAKIYIDGSLDSTHSFSGNIDYSSMADDEFFIGKRPGYSQYITGKIDDVSIFNIGLSVVQIAAIYNSGAPTDLSAESDLIGYWLLGEGANWNNTNWQLPDYSKKNLFSQKSFDFDGINDYVDLGNDSSLMIGTGDFTISGWIKLGATNSGYAGMIGKFGTISTTHYDYMFGLFGMKLVILVGVGTGGGIWGGYKVGATTLSTGQWYHIAVTLDRDGDATLYLNGSPDGSVAMTGSEVNIVSTNAYSIGNSEGYFGGVGDNLIDDVAIFNSVKAIGDIWDGTGKPTDLSEETGLVGYWTFDDATYGAAGWTVPDNSSNSNNGTSSGMVETDLLLESPTNSNNGTSSGMAETNLLLESPTNSSSGTSFSGMAIDDRVTDAPDNENQANSVLMEEGDRSTNVPT